MKFAELTIKGYRLLCSSGYTENWHRITLKLKKSFKSDILGKVLEPFYNFWHKYYSMLMWRQRFWSLSLDGSQLFWQHGGEGLHYIREVILILWLITVHSYYKSKEKKKIPPGCFCDYRKWLLSSFLTLSIEDFSAGAGAGVQWFLQSSRLW